jgi:acetolactate synthase-1/2/3 large subunit
MLTASEPIPNVWNDSEIAIHRDAFQAALRPSTENFAPHQVIDIVREILPRDGILTYDVGAHTHQVASQWTAHGPRQCHITNGWSSMGFGLPAAIAAKIARPDLPVVCLLGDGCFQMTCGELATAKRMGLTLPVVVLDDRWLGLIRVKQERRQLAVYGTSLQQEEYRDPPEHYFGIPAIGARDGNTLRAALSDALQAEGPTVIEAVVDPEHYFETIFD